LFIQNEQRPIVNVASGKTLTARFQIERSSRENSGLSEAHQLGTKKTISSHLNTLGAARQVDQSDRAGSRLRAIPPPILFENSRSRNYSWRWGPSAPSAVGKEPVGRSIL
jgi:hypothetical protein